MCTVRSTVGTAIGCVGMRWKTGGNQASVRAHSAISSMGVGSANRIQPPLTAGMGPVCEPHSDVADPRHGRIS